VNSPLNKNAALLLVSASVYCQVPTQSAIATCIADLKGDLILLQQIKTDYTNKNMIALMKDVLIAEPKITKTIADCQAITKADIIGFIYQNLTSQQKTCLADVMTVTFELKAELEFLKQKKWTQFFTEIVGIAQTTVITVNDCKAAFNF
jgi:hypothetical protein